MRLLIGYDGSECADLAIQSLHRAGLPADTEALVLSVAKVAPMLPTVDFEGGYGPGSNLATTMALRAGQIGREAIDHNRKLSEGAAEFLRKAFPGWTVTSDVGADSPGAALVETADAWHADLLVLGSHGHSMMARLLLGSVSQMVVSHARCSTRIVRCPEQKRTGPIRIVLGIDASPSSAVAVAAVAQRKWPEDTEVHVLTAIDLHGATLFSAAAMSPTEGITVVAPDDAAQNWAHRAVENAARELRDAGLNASTRVENGDPATLLLAEAQHWQADCIFVGAKGHSRLERLLLGSVSSTVAARAHCSVEVVRAVVD